MLNTHTTATGINPGVTSRNFRPAKAAKTAVSNPLPVAINRQPVDDASLNTELSRWSTPKLCPSFKSLAQDLQVSVGGQTEQKIQNALRTGQTVALTLSASSAPIMIALNDKLQLVANGPQTHNCPVEYSSDDYGVDLHFVNDLGHEVYLTEHNRSGDQTVILREKQVRGEDWLCLTLKKSQEGTTIGLNSTHDFRGSQIETNLNGGFQASYHDLSDSRVSLYVNPDSFECIAFKDANKTMNAGELRNALIHSRADLGTADRRVSDFLAQF